MEARDVARSVKGHGGQEISSNLPERAWMNCSRGRFLILSRPEAQRMSANRALDVNFWLSLMWRKCPE
jgi:hypothetical protein